MPNNDIPELLFELYFPLENPAVFSISVETLEHPDVLVALFSEQSSMAPQPDDLGNMQAGVRIDQIEDTYWIRAREGTTQSEIDAAVAQYDTRKAEMYP